MRTKEQKKRFNAWRRKQDRERRMMCIKHYSNNKKECSCCGEKHLEFLAIDHINGGGGKHRKKVQGSYRNIYTFLVKNNYPKGYRVLCHNCNLSIGFYGYCPHNINRPR